MNQALYAHMNNKRKMKKKKKKKKKKCFWVVVIWEILNLTSEANKNRICLTIFH
jgi:hypothetical protein